VPYALYSLYWDSQDVLIRDLFADDLGQILNQAYVIPASATIGTHQVLAVDEGGSVVAQATFVVIE
jgi:hypothetical protein